MPSIIIWIVAGRPKFEKYMSGVLGEVLVSGITEPQMSVGTSNTAFTNHQDDFSLPSVVQVLKGLKVKYFNFTYFI